MRAWMLVIALIGHALAMAEQDVEYATLTMPLTKASLGRSLPVVDDVQPFIASPGVSKRKTQSLTAVGAWSVSSRSRLVMTESQLEEMTLTVVTNAPQLVESEIGRILEGLGCVPFLFARYTGEPMRNGWLYISVRGSAVFLSGPSLEPIALRRETDGYAVVEESFLRSRRGLRRFAPGVVHEINLDGSVIYLFEKLHDTGLEGVYQREDRPWRETLFIWDRSLRRMELRRGIDDFRVARDVLILERNTAAFEVHGAEPWFVSSIGCPWNGRQFTLLDPANSEEIVVQERYTIEMFGSQLRVSSVEIGVVDRDLFSGEVLWCEAIRDEDGVARFGRYIGPRSDPEEVGNLKDHLRDSMVFSKAYFVDFNEILRSADEVPIVVDERLREILNRVGFERPASAPGLINEMGDFGTFGLLRQVTELSRSVMPEGEIVRQERD